LFWGEHLDRIRFAPEVIGFGSYVSLLACQNLPAVEIATIGAGIEMVKREERLSLAMPSLRVVNDPSRYSSPHA